MSILDISAQLDKFQTANPSTIEAGGVEAKAALFALALVQPRGGASTGRIQIFDNEAQALRDIAAEDLPSGYTEQTPTSITVLGVEGGDASLILDADESDDAADTWTIKSVASGNTLQFLNGATLIAHLVATGAVFAANMNITCAAGTTALDLSLGTGVTKTTSGVNTIGGLMLVKSITTAVAAAGSTVTDAAVLGAANVQHITSDGAAKGVKFATAALGDIRFVINDSSTAAELYAASGGTVNGLAPDASVVVPASKGLLCFCTAADTWIAFDLTALATAS